MSNLTPDAEPEGFKSNDSFDLNPDAKEPTRSLLRRDPTGGLLSTVLFMDNVENWVIDRVLARPRDPENADEDINLDEVRSRMQRLSEIITQYRLRIPPDNYALVQLLGWMKSSEAFYALDYLSQYQPEFTMQFIAHCGRTRNDDVNADLAMQRVHVLFRTRLADRIYSRENCEYVMSVLLNEEA